MEIVERNMSKADMRGTAILPGSKLDFGQNLNGLAIVRGAKYGVHQFLYGHGQCKTRRARWR